ncbi:MAG: NAD-dependent epimerase/dehydratase family protein [Candidatus Heimdallarchaeaceae archaeon]
MERILVTGATGCTGSGVLKYLLSNGYTSVFGLTRRVPINPLEGVKYVTGDITDTNSLKKLFEENEFDWVFHYAAAIHRTKIENFYKVNIVGTKNLLNITENSSVQALIYTSSTGVYGKILETPAKETHRKKPWGIYSRSKLLAEQIIRERCSELGVKGGILRPPLILGKGDRHFYPVVEKLVKWNVMPIMGNPNHRISIVHPYDIGLASEILAKKRVKEFSDYNVVSQNVSFKKLILDIEKEIVGKNKFKYYLPYPIVFLGAWALEAIYGALTPNKDPLFNREYAQMIGRDWVFDYSKLIKLGYKPMMSIEFIIKDLIKQAHFSAPKIKIRSK